MKEQTNTQLSIEILKAFRAILVQALAGVDKILEDNA